MSAALASDHQPIARLTAGLYRAGCLCGWADTKPYENRAGALVMARILHDDLLEENL